MSKGKFLCEKKMALDKTSPKWVIVNANGSEYGDGSKIGCLMVG
jgi:hypothetical protein